MDESGDISLILFNSPLTSDTWNKRGWLWRLLFVFLCWAHLGRIFSGIAGSGAVTADVQNEGAYLV